MLGLFTEKKLLFQSFVNRNYMSTRIIYWKINTFTKASSLDNLLKSKRSITLQISSILVASCELLRDIWLHRYCAKACSYLHERKRGVTIPVSLFNWACLAEHSHREKMRYYTSFLKVFWCVFCHVMTRVEGFHSLIITCDVILAVLTYPSVQEKGET